MENHKRLNREEDSGLNLRRVFLGPAEEVKPLETHELGIKSDVKGLEIKQCVDRAVHKLVYQGLPKVTLKAIGKNKVT